MEVDFLAKMTDQPDVPLKSFDSGIGEFASILMKNKIELKFVYKYRLYSFRL